MYTRGSVHICSVPIDDSPIEGLCVLGRVKCRNWFGLRNRGMASKASPAKRGEPVLTAIHKTHAKTCT